MHDAEAPDILPAEQFERLIRENQVSLKRLCFLYLHDETLAEDAVQETFLKAFRSLRSFRGEASEKTWLVRIAMNTCKDILRSAWFRHIDHRVTIDNLPDRSEPQDDSGSEITVAVMNLPRTLREVVILYYYLGINTLEAAGILGISQPAVTARLKRARKKLSNDLKGCDMDEA